MTTDTLNTQAGFRSQSPLLSLRMCASSFCSLNLLMGSNKSPVLMGIKSSADNCIFTMLPSRAVPGLHHTHPWSSQPTFTHSKIAQNQVEQNPSHSHQIGLLSGPQRMVGLAKRPTRALHFPRDEKDPQPSVLNCKRFHLTRLSLSSDLLAFSCLSPSPSRHGAL